MNTLKFLEEIKILKNKLRQKVGNENGRISFPVLIQQLVASQHLDEQIVSDLKKLWQLRNKIYSSPTPENEVPSEAQTLLTSLISNPNLQ